MNKIKIISVLSAIFMIFSSIAFAAGDTFTSTNLLSQFPNNDSVVDVSAISTDSNSIDSQTQDNNSNANTSTNNTGTDVTDNQVTDNQANDNQTTNDQVTDNQVTDSQATDSQTTNNQTTNNNSQTPDNINTNTSTTDTGANTSDSQNVTLAQVIQNINNDPSNQANYDLAAKLYTNAGETNINIFVNGNIIDFSKYDNVFPIVKDGRTLVPLKAVSEALGANVSWDGSKALITITLDSKVIKLTLNNTTAYVNDAEVTLDVPAQSINSRTMVPLKFISQAFGEKAAPHYYQNNFSVISVVK